MNNKYNRAIHEIKASDEFKNRLINDMNQKQEEINIQKNSKYAKKNKLRNSMTTILGILGLLCGSGLVYAGITGNLKFGNGNIEFSESVEEYKEDVENQKLESDGNIIELTSKVCDDGFVILQFDVTLSDEQSQLAEESCGLQYLSFNDELTTENGVEEPRLAGANYNLIIDGENYWLRGATDFEVIENEPNKNYTVYELWFLSDEEIGDKEDFVVTLNDVRMMVGEKLTNFEGSFDIELSKSKVVENTTTYEPANSQIEYERLTHNIDKIIESPMQTLIKTKSTLNDVTKRNFNNLDEDDYIGYLKYNLYDQNGNEVSEFDLITKYVYYYEDGTIKETDNEEGISYDGFYKYDTEEYIAIAQNSDITELNMEVFEVNEYTGITRNIGLYKIDLSNGNVISENKNEITETDEDAPNNWDIEYIDKDEIPEFSIDIPDNEYTITRVYEELNESGGACETDAENADLVTYEIDLKDTDAYFQLILFKNQTAKNIYDKYDMYITGDDDCKPITVKEQGKYTLVLNAFSKYNYNLIKDIIDTIELK